MANKIQVMVDKVIDNYSWSDKNSTYALREQNEIMFNALLAVRSAFYDAELTDVGEDEVVISKDVYQTMDGILKELYEVTKDLHPRALIPSSDVFDAVEKWHID